MDVVIHIKGTHAGVAQLQRVRRGRMVQIMAGGEGVIASEDRGVGLCGYRAFEGVHTDSIRR